MPLLAPGSIRPLLRCPRCRGPLTDREYALTCASPTCALASRGFPNIGGQPALVDFERSVVVESELRSRRGNSAVTRRTDRGWRGLLKHLAAPPNHAATAHSRDLVSRLSARTAPESAGDPPALLIVGGGTRGRGTEPLDHAPGLAVVSFDIYASENTQFVADAHQIPLADASVQAVWIQAVLEHVLEPSRVVDEIVRVLAPGGLVYAETPFLQHVHEGPWDFSRFTASGHRWLFRRFECLDSGVVAGPATVWVWATEQLVRGLTRSMAAGRAARMALSWVHGFDRWIPPDHALDGASCVYFYGRRSGEPIGPRDAVEFYPGAQRPR